MPPASGLALALWPTSALGEFDVCVDAKGLLLDVPLELPHADVIKLNATTEASVKSGTFLDMLESPFKKM